MTIFFENPGLIELDTIRTMGVNVKTNDNPIGFFGTGMKMAIAVLLRENHEVTLIRGMDRIDFSKKSKSIRGKDFDFVFMGDEQLAFTTELGKNWEVWQAYRELHSNCLDEGGRISRTPALEGPGTTFEVSGEQIEKVFDERFTIFLPTEPAWVVDQLEVHRGASSYLYYRGIRVAKLPKPTLYTYNLMMQMKLTEDRTLDSMYDAQYRIGARLPMIEDPKFCEKILNPEADAFESGLDFTYSYSPSDEFLDVVEKNLDNAKANQSAKLLFKEKRKVPLSKKSCLLSQIEIMSVMEAIEMLPIVNCDLRYEDIVFVESLGASVQGCVEEGQIYISRECLTKGVQWIASTLYEEWVHVKMGYQDETRGLQNFLLDKLFQLVREIKK